MHCKKKDGEQASTQVTLNFPRARGAIYVVDGICKDVKAWWKDNATIIIERNMAHQALIQHQQVRSFDDTIMIEYTIPSDVSG